MKYWNHITCMQNTSWKTHTRWPYSFQRRQAFNWTSEAKLSQVSRHYWQQRSYRTQNIERSFQELVWIQDKTVVTGKNYFMTFHIHIKDASYNLFLLLPHSIFSLPTTTTNANSTQKHMDALSSSYTKFQLIRTSVEIIKRKCNNSSCSASSSTCRSPATSSYFALRLLDDRCNTPLQLSLQFLMLLWNTWKSWIYIFLELVRLSI